MARRTQKAVQQAKPVVLPKDVTKPTAPVSPLAPEAKGDTVNIAALLVRGEARDRKYFGTLVEDLLRSPTGDLLIRTIHQLKARALRSKGPSDVRIGVMEGLEQLLESLELYVVQKKQLEMEEEDKKEMEQWTKTQDRLGHMAPTTVGAGEE